MDHILNVQHQGSHTNKLILNNPVAWGRHAVIVSADHTLQCVSMQNVSCTGLPDSPVVQPLHARTVQYTGILRSKQPAWTCLIS